METNSDIKEVIPFVVGDMYMIQVTPAYGRPGEKIKAKCSKVQRYNVFFDYLSMWDGILHRCNTKRRLVNVPHRGYQEAVVRDVWTTICPSNSVEDHCEKSESWDEKWKNAQES